MSLPRIGITLGDPNGVGPEIALKAVSGRALNRVCRPLLFGSLDVVQKTAAHYGMDPGRVPVYDTGPYPDRLRFGRVTRAGGRAAIRAVDAAVASAKNGEIDAMVTGPLSKEAVCLSGLKGFSGHTGYIARAFGSPEHCLCLYSHSVAIAFVSTHVSLKTAIRSVKKARIVKVTRLLHAFFRRLGVRAPRIGVSGLNPHAGEGGLFGREEVLEIVPAIRALKKSGLRAAGPEPPDVIFPRFFSGQYHGVVSMVHDHGHVAFKTALFRFGARGKKTSGVNVTLGLPVVRTSVDHGTAFDIAGKNLADTGSLLDAVRLAVKLSV
jgi:4-hydroxythreonine-4-phosphate dehydrogenase